MRARARENLLNRAIKSLLRHEEWDELGKALLSDTGGLSELAYRIDEASDHTAPGFLAVWDQTISGMGRRTYCFIAEEAEDPAAYLATLV